MKRILLYIIVFLAAFYYVDNNRYYSIEPLSSIFGGIERFVQNNELTALVVALMIVVLVYIFFDKLLKI